MEQKQFLSAIEQICDEKGISRERVIETIEMALAAAYKKDYGKKGQMIRAKFNPETGQIKMRQIKLVVDQSMLKEEPDQNKESLQATAPVKSEEAEEAEEESSSGQVVDAEQKVRFNPERHIMIDEALKKKKKIKPGEEFAIRLKEHEDFGRIAAQTAKQVIIQRIREAERDAVYDNFKEKEGQVLSGIVQRLEGNSVFFDLGKGTGILFPDQQIPSEDYRLNQRKRVYLVEVLREARGPLIVLSRAHPKLVSRLFEFEVPEIASGVVTIKSIAREPGSRTKIAVASEKSEIDPIGACVGQRGTRVQAVINELAGEKIDIILYDKDPEKFIAHALSPGKVIEVEMRDEKRKEARAIVAEDQLSLTIGKAGQNVRLAAKLTGWKIDVVKEAGDKQEKVEKIKKTEKVAKTEKTAKVKKAEKKAKKLSQEKDKTKKTKKEIKKTEKKKKSAKKEKIIKKLEIQSSNVKSNPLNQNLRFGSGQAKSK